jgi:hypothetical protein
VIGHNSVSIHVERVAIGSVFVFVGAFEGFAELLFEDAFAVFEGAEFLREDLVARLFLLFHALRHLFERGDGLRLLFVGDERAGLCVDDERGFAAGADERETCGVRHNRNSSIRNIRTRVCGNVCAASITLRETEATVDGVRE